MATIKFWGVRGSIPTPGPSTIKYGGNTACSELRYKDKLFILDAGSGIRSLGNELMKQGTGIQASILISHLHWDHIQGIPFFVPALIPGNDFTFYGAEDPEKDLATTIAEQMNPINFPIELKDMGSKLNFKPLSEGSYEIDGIKVDTLFINHPGYALGYKLHFDDRSLVYISDNEPFASADENSDELYIGEDGTEKLINFIKGATVLIHDAQYTPEEYKGRVTWGHSPYNYTVDLGLKAGVDQLILFHHDPMHDDDYLDNLLAEAQKIVKDSGSEMDLLMAREGAIFEF